MWLNIQRCALQRAEYHKVMYCHTTIPKDGLPFHILKRIDYVYYRRSENGGKDAVEGKTKAGVCTYKLVAVHGGRCSESM